MISLLPLPGGFITLANRCLSPAVVRFRTFISDSKGFVCGWSYWLSRAMSFGLELVALQKVMAIWLQEERYTSIWITIFFVAIVLFNLLNVRRYGEIEYWLTVTKLTTIVGLIILGLVLSMGASAKTRQLGTSLDNIAIPCPVDGQCLGTPGFECTSISESINF
jgi:amino acid permease